MATGHVTAVFSTQATISSGGSRIAALNLGAASANRKALACVLWYRNTNRLQDVGLEIDGVACDVLDGAAEVGVNEVCAKLFELVAPASGTVNAEIFATSWGGGGSSTECYIVVLIVDGAEQASHAANVVVATGGPVTGPPVTAQTTTPSVTDALVASFLIMDSTDVSYNAATISNGVDRGQQLNVFNSGVRVAVVTTPGATSVNPQAEWSSGVGGAVTSYWRAISVSIPAASSGSTTDQSAAGTVALSGALTRQVSRTAAGAVQPAGQLVTQVMRAVALSGAVTPAGAVTRQVARAIGGVIAPAGSVGRAPRVSVAGAVVPSGALTKRAPRAAAGAVAPSGTVQATRVSLRSVDGAVTPTGALTRRGGKAAGGTVAPTGTLARQPQKRVTGAIAPTGAVTRLQWRLVGGTIAPIGTVTKRTARELAGAVATAGQLQTQFNVAIDLLELTFTAELGPRLTVPIALSPRLVLDEVTLSPSLSMAALSPTELALNTDALLRLRGVKVWDPTSGTRIPATGLTITAHLATTPTGAAIHATLSVTLSERAPGDFHGTLQGDAINTHVRAYLGQLVYLVLSVGAGDFVGHFPLRVVDGVRVGG